MAELRRFRTYTGVQKWSISAQKVGVAHAQRDCINAKFQVSVQINECLLYKKSKQIRYKLKFKKEVGITIKCKETSSKQAITGYPLYKLH